MNPAVATVPLRIPPPPGMLSDEPLLFIQTLLAAIVGSAIVVSDVGIATTICGNIKGARVLAADGLNVDVLNKISEMGAIGKVMAPGICKVPTTDVTAPANAGVPAIAIVRALRLVLVARLLIN